eukprot:5050267-Amphidinium_carterae.1
MADDSSRVSDIRIDASPNMTEPITPVLALPRRILARACPTTVQDWDIANSQPTLLLQLCNKLGLSGLDPKLLELNALR